MYYFCTIFGAFSAKPKELEKLEKEISVLSSELAEEEKIKKLARMIYAEELKDDRRKIAEPKN